MKRRQSRLRHRPGACATVAFLGVLALANLAHANGPPIQAETAFVTGLNGAAVRSFGKVVRKSGAAGEVTAFVAPVVVPYELVDNKLVIGAGLPLVTKTLRLADGASRSAGFGIGDLFLFGKFNIYQSDAPQETFRVAGKIGLTFPTGTDDVSDARGLLPPSLQRGTGSVNPSAMLIATKLWRRFGVNADVGYTALPEANGIDRGDVVRYDLAGAFRLLPWVFDTYPDHQLNLMLEVNGEWSEKGRLEGLVNSDSGGHVLFVSPGLQYMYSTVIVEASVQLPALSDLNGTQLAPDWTALLGVRWLIF